MRCLWFGSLALFACQLDSGGTGMETPTSGGDEASGPGVDDGQGRGATGSGDAGEAGESAAGSTETPLTCDTAELSAMYTRYVEPFVSGSVASSCSACHMTGIDIGLYAQDTPCETMACMVDMGVVNLDNPSASTLLAQILLGESDSSVFNVQAEHDAIEEWIEWSSQCHGEVCGAVESACQSGTGTPSTGVQPLGDCSETDLLAQFWDAVIIDRQRCVTCHSDFGESEGTFGPCDSADDCMAMQLCLGGSCKAPGPATAPHFFEGGGGALSWNNPEHRALGLNTMYNFAALGLFDRDDPLASTAATKPLLEGFSPTAIYGSGVSMEGIPAGAGVGVAHGGTSKFSFGCHSPPCPTSGVVDCRRAEPCSNPSQCGVGKECLGTDEEKFCRDAGSLCDETYVAYIRFAQAFAACK